MPVWIAIVVSLRSSFDLKKQKVVTVFHTFAIRITTSYRYIRILVIQYYNLNLPTKFTKMFSRVHFRVLNATKLVTDWDL